MKGSSSCRLDCAGASPFALKAHGVLLQLHLSVYSIIARVLGRRVIRRRLVRGFPCGIIGIEAACCVQTSFCAARRAVWPAIGWLPYREGSMRLKRLGIPKVIAILAALLMVVAGLLISRAGGGPEAAASPAAVSPTPVVAPAPVAEAVEATQEEAPAEAAEPKEAEAEAAAEAKTAAAPVAAPKGTSAPVPARKAAAAPKPSPRRSLPPLPPPEWSAQPATEESSGPPPGVLWLSGVIQGEPRVALLRRGESRYVVREGDTFEERYRVVTISSNSVTLERGGKKQTLRVGQY